MIDVGSTKQIFADDHLIESMTHVFRVLNPGQKHAGNPLIVADRPWEETPNVYVYGTAVHDPGAEGPDAFRLWYAAGVAEYGRGDHAGLLFARSADGIHWEKPSLGVAELGGSKDNNALWVNNSRGWRSADGLSHDPDDPDPARRYKMLLFLGAEEPESARPGYGAFFSPDGIHWKPDENNPVVKYDHVSVCEVATTIYNEQSANPRKGHPLDRHRHYGSVKYSSYMCQPIHDRSFGYMRRAAGIMTSDDFINWSPNHLVLQPDEIDDFLCRQRVMAASPILRRNRPEEHRAEFYGMPLMPYGDILLGFLWVFDASGSVNDDGGNQDGPTHVQLVGTRDLRRWHRLGQRMPLLAPGVPGQWDCGSIHTCNRPIVVGDEIRLYYSGSNHGHGAGPDAVGSIGLATWRLDGFVSINANSDTGTLTTKPLTFSGDRLLINADASGGEIAVELLDEAGRPITDFEASDCVPLGHDCVRYEVAWKNRMSLAGLVGKPVKLTFHMNRAKLFSLVFSSATR